MSLTTPELKDHDAVFPCENWFLYWKSAPSLWEVKLKEYTGVDPVYIPINWGYHNERDGFFDFGTYKPETNLKYLFEVAQKVGVNICIVLPLSPAPFIVNGGVPSYLVRYMAIDKNGMGVSVCDSMGSIHKVYSFFDPKVFQAFRQFCIQLGGYLRDNGISWEVYGGDFGFIEKQQFISYRDDYSVIFDQSFSRYLKQIQQSEPEKYDQLLNDPDREELIKAEFSLMIKDLYYQAAKESCSGSWERVLSFSLLGGKPLDVFTRSSQLCDNDIELFEDHLNTLVMNIIPSSLLLSDKEKKETLSRSMSSIVSSEFLISHMQNSYYHDESLAFSPLVFFDVYFPTVSYADVFKKIQQYAIKNYLVTNFNWSYRFSRELHFEIDQLQDHKIHIIFGSTLDSDTLKTVLKLFMNGARIIIDSSGLQNSLLKRLQTFLDENDISCEHVNFLTNITKAQMGEGILQIYDGEKLSNFNMLKKANFWKVLVDFISIKHLKIESDSDLFYYWRARSSNSFELDYEQVRRVSFFNPTSYKKKAKVISENNFAFLKTIDQKNATIASTPVGIKVELLPGGSLSLDFGYFES